MTPRDRARRAPATGLTGLLASEATELGDLARRAVPSRRRAWMLGLALLALLALSGVAGAAEPDPDNRSALDAWGASPAAPAASAPVGSAPAASAASAPVASGAPAVGAATGDPIPAGALGTSALFAGPDVLDLGLKALLVIAALFVTLRILRRVQGGGTARKAGLLLDVVESRSIGPKAQLHLVAVGERRIVVGQTPSGLVALGELDAAELPLGDAAAILETLGIPADEPVAATRPRPEAAPARIAASTGRDLPHHRAANAGGRPIVDRPRAAIAGDPPASGHVATRPAVERPATDRPAPDRRDGTADMPASPRPVPPAWPMDVRVAAYARPIADLDELAGLDDLPSARAIRPPRPVPVSTPVPSIVTPAPRHAAPSVDERVARAAARARADRASDAARAERRARVDRALAAADRAALVAERTAEAAARALAAAELAAVERAVEPIARARAATSAPRMAAARPAPRSIVAERQAVQAPPAEAVPESLLALALRLAAAGRGREAQVERAASSLAAPRTEPVPARTAAPATTAAAPARTAAAGTDIAAILAALAAESAAESAAAEPADAGGARPAERPRAPRRLEVSA